MENKVALSVNNLNIGYGNKTLCSGISFDISEGDCIMLCGANGSGKTTLMKALCNDNTADIVRHGEIIMIPARIPKVSGFSLKEFVRICCFNKSDLYGKLSPVDEDHLTQAINELRLQHLSDRDISTLSDGEFQKAGIASALVRKASVILLDEPTAFLDAENRISVLESLQSLCTKGNEHKPAVIFSTHDLHDGLKVCSNVFAMGADGRFYKSENSSYEAKKEAVSSIFSESSQYLG